MTDQVQTIQSMDGNGSRVSILEYQQLIGSNSLESARTLYFAAQSGMRLRQVFIQINACEVVLEAGALQYMKGNIVMETKSGGLGGLVTKIAASALTNESTFRPRYKGVGEIMLEPAFAHFLLIKLNGEEMITDKGMFYASEGTVNVGVAMQKNISSALFGNEGFFQTRISGTGWVVLASPVPLAEIRKVVLNNEKLQVDGNFALLRKGKIEFKVEKSSKSIFGTARSGEGLLQTFAGTGEVWLAPTQDIYERMRAASLSALVSSQHSSNTQTNTKV